MKFELPVAALATALALSSLANGSPLATPIAGAAASALTPAPPNVPAAPTTDCCRLAAGTVVVIELAQPVSSKTHKRGDRFALRLAEPVVVDGKTILPAGAPGFGEVVDAASGGMGGRPAKLVLAARSIEAGGVQVLLRGFHLGGGGSDNSTAALAVSAVPYVGILAIAIPGGDVEYPAGTRANAKVTADVTVPPTPPAHAAPTSSTQGTKP